MPIKLTQQYINSLKRQKYRLINQLKVSNEDQATEFINQVGFLTLFGIQRIELPTLWDATAPSKGLSHWDTAWLWKNSLPAKKKCCYTKLIRRKGTFISWEFFPKFFVVYGSRTHYLDDYYDGKLSILEKQILDILDERGALDTDQLRKLVGLPSKKGTCQFHKALEDLQTSLRVVVAGGSVTRAGWTIHKWDLVDNFIPETVWDAIYSLSREQAMKDIILKYLDTVVISTEPQIAYTFKWDLATVKEFINQLQAERQVIKNIEFKGIEHKYLITPANFKTV